MFTCEFSSSCSVLQVDHFSFANNDVFSMKYLVNDTWWNGNGGPIFFYAGNEGDIELFLDNTVCWLLRGFSD